MTGGKNGQYLDRNAPPDATDPLAKDPMQEYRDIVRNKEVVKPMDNLPKVGPDVTGLAQEINEIIIKTRISLQLVKFNEDMRMAKRVLALVVKASSILNSETLHPFYKSEKGQVIMMNYLLDGTVPTSYSQNDKHWLQQQADYLKRNESLIMNSK